MENFKKLSIILIVFGSCLFGEIIFGIVAFALACGEAISLYFLFPIIAENIEKIAKSNREKKIERLEKQLNDLKTEKV